jgi:exopolysaccharide production protein ExoQ
MGRHREKNRCVFQVRDVTRRGEEMSSPRRRPIWEKLFATVALFLSTAALIPLLRTDGVATQPTAEGDPAIRKIWLLLYAVTLLLLFNQRVNVAGVMARNKLLFGTVAVAVASTTWSVDPTLTLRQAIALVLTTLFGVYLASAYSQAELLSLVSWLLAGIVCASIFFALFEPSYGLDSERGNAWRGVFTTKNELGRMAAFAIAVWLLRVFTDRRHSLVSLCVVAISIVTLLESSSSTGLLAVIIVIVFYALLPALRAHKSVAVPTAALLISGSFLGMAWLAAHPNSILSGVGADASLTGRTALWDVVWQMISIHPWLGWGYGAFWQGDAGPSAFVWSAVSWHPPHAHDGFLDLWLGVGVVGLILFVAMLAYAFVRAFFYLRLRAGSLALFPFVFVLFVSVYSLSESTLFTQNTLFWILFVAVSVRLAQPSPALSRANLRRSVQEGSAFPAPGYQLSPEGVSWRRPAK